MENKVYIRKIRNNEYGLDIMGVRGWGIPSKVEKFSRNLSKSVIEKLKHWRAFKRFHDFLQKFGQIIRIIERNTKSWWKFVNVVYIIWLQFLLKNQYFKWIKEETPKGKFEFSFWGQGTYFKNFGGWGVCMHHCQTLALASMH